MRTTQRYAECLLLAAALLVGLAPAFGAAGLADERLPVADAPASWPAWLAWFGGWGTPEEDGALRDLTAAGRPKTGGGGEQGSGVDPDGTDPDPGDAEPDPGLPPGAG